MTYWEFHLYLTGPAILVGSLGWVWLARSSPSPRPDLSAEVGAVGLLAGIAFCYTLPWDHLLIGWEVWTYDVGRVSATLWGVPVEECAFFVLQTILAGSWYAVTARLGEAGPFPFLGVSEEPGRSRPANSTNTSLKSRWGAVLGGLLTVLGVGLISLQRSFYLGMILLWGGPVLALQWGIWGRGLWRRRRTIGLAVGAASLYLWIADRIALGAGIWHITPRYTVGLSPFGLPIEEALFFLLTNVFVVQGMVMLTDPESDFVPHYDSVPRRR